MFGGPLLTILKAATAVARAKEATRATGVEHVPIFWMATEDHDLAEVDQVSLLSKTTVETLRAGLRVPRPVPVGGVVPGPEIEKVLEQASELLAYAPVTDWLRECYLPESDRKPTLANSFGRLIAKIFAEQGLIVIDASTREFHALGAKTLRYAIEHACIVRQQIMAFCPKRTFSRKTISDALKLKPILRGATRGTSRATMRSSTHLPRIAQSRRQMGSVLKYIATMYPEQNPSLDFD